MRLPLYLTVNVCLIGLAGAGVLGLISGDTAAQAAQREALDQGLDGLIAAWTAAETPPEAHLAVIRAGRTCVRAPWLFGVRESRACALWRSEGWGVSPWESEPFPGRRAFWAFRFVKKH